jgi:hypothetical protein
MKSIIPRKMTNAEMRALDGEIRKQVAVGVGNLQSRIEATVLWQLHTQLDLDVEELEAFLEAFQPALQELKTFYEIESAEDTELACVYNLKAIGFDTSKLGNAFPVEYTVNGR